MKSEKSVWVFNTVKSQLPEGIFENLDLGELWIEENNLTGVLTKYPLNRGVFDWAKENDSHKHYIFYL